MQLRRARVNAFKVVQESSVNAFRKWKGTTRFVVEVDGEGIPRRLFTSSPDDMGKVLALYIKKITLSSAELVSDRRKRGLDDIEGRVSVLERSEIEPILNALVCGLGQGNVDYRASIRKG